MKKIVAICGAGIATSTMVVNKIKKILEENGIEGVVTKGLALETKQLVKGADLVVATTQLRADIDVPVVNGVPFLTGIGEEEVKQKILDILNKE